MEITTENILQAVRKANRDQYHFMYEVKVNILKGFECDLWKANHIDSYVPFWDRYNSWRIDGILQRPLFKIEPL